MFNRPGLVIMDGKKGNEAVKAAAADIRIIRERMKAQPDAYKTLI